MKLSTVSDDQSMTTAATGQTEASVLSICEVRNDSQPAPNVSIVFSAFSPAAGLGKGNCAVYVSSGNVEISSCSFIGAIKPVHKPKNYYINEEENDFVKENKLKVNLKKQKSTSFDHGNYDEHDGVCEWSSSLLYLSNCEAKLSHSVFAHSSSGGVFVSSGKLVVNDCTFHNNDPSLLDYPSVRRNIFCRDGAVVVNSMSTGEEEAAMSENENENNRNLKKQSYLQNNDDDNDDDDIYYTKTDFSSSSSSNPSSLWISPVKCTVTGAAVSSSLSPFFTPQLQSTKLVSRSNESFVEYQLRGSLLLPCSTSLVVFCDGAEAEKRNYPITEYVNESYAVARVEEKEAFYCAVRKNALLNSQLSVNSSSSSSSPDEFSLSSRIKQSTAEIKLNQSARISISLQEGEKPKETGSIQVYFTHIDASEKKNETENNNTSTGNGKKYSTASVLLGAGIGIGISIVVGVIVGVFLYGKLKKKLSGEALLYKRMESFADSRKKLSMQGEGSSNSGKKKQKKPKNGFISVDEYDGGFGEAEMGYEDSGSGKEFEMQLVEEGEIHLAPGDSSAVTITKLPRQGEEMENAEEGERMGGGGGGEREERNVNEEEEEGREGRANEEHFVRWTTVPTSLRAPRVFY